MAVVGHVGTMKRLSLLVCNRMCFLEFRLASYQYTSVKDLTCGVKLHRPTLLPYHGTDLVGF